MMTESQLRELDAWLAEHVMGFVRCEMGWQEWCAAGKDKKGRKQERLLFTKCFEAWSPTTKPADALSVLEKCIVKYDARIAASKHPKLEVVVWCEGLGVEVTAPTLALAICLFAQQVFETKPTTVPVAGRAVR